MPLDTATQTQSTARRGLTAEQKISRYNWTTTQSPGELAWVAKGLLGIDHSYQRDELSGAVGEIRRNFNWLAFGVLIVARRDDGTLWVVEGQQRLTAVRGRADIPTVPCIIFDVEDTEQEAKGFLDTNERRKPVTAVDKFRARIMTNDAAAQLCDKLIAEAGYQVSKRAGGRQIKCVGRMQFCAAHDPEALKAIWPLIVECCEGEPIHERVLEGLFYLQRMAEPSPLEQPFRKRLLRLGREGIIRTTAEAATYYSKGGAKVWATGILDKVNKGARSNTMEWK